MVKKQKPSHLIVKNWVTPTSSSVVNGRSVVATPMRSRVVTSQTRSDLSDSKSLMEKASEDDDGLPTR